MNTPTFCVIPPPNPKNNLSVQEVFKEKNLFITGATGFMGKILVEKLLWSCHGIGNIYLLVRPKKGCDVQQRLDALLNTPVFERIKKRDPKILSKLILISGDCSELNIGISEEDSQLLSKNVSIIFHVASSVRFNDSLKKAVLMNVRGTREVINIATTMKNLKALVYVSTIFSYTDKPVIEERLFKADIDWRILIKAAETIDDNVLNALQNKIIEKQPNTYAFTKYLAENVVNEYAKTLPIVIYRPSAVVGTVSSPIPGWIEDFNGPIGLAMGFLSGLIHVLYAEPNKRSDYICCDTAINGLILSTWYRCLVNTDTSLIFNATHGKEKKTSNEELVRIASDLRETLILQTYAGYPFYFVIDNKYLYYLLVLITHVIPAMLIDVILKFRGIKFRLLTAYRKLFIANESLSFFMINDWIIKTENYDMLETYINDADKLEYKYDVRDLDKNKAIEYMMRGMQKYVLKEDESEAAKTAAKKNFRRIKLFGTIVKWVFAISIGCIFTHYLMKTYTEYCEWQGIC